MSDLTERLDVSTPVFVLILALVVAQVGLALFALADLWKRDRVAGGRKWLWAALILIGNFAGPIIYLTVGRDVPPEILDEAPSHRDTSLTHTERIRRGVEALYGPLQ